MQLRLRRIAKKESYTIGKLEVFCEGSWLWVADTLEPSLTRSHRPAIPAGTYKITLGIKSPKYSNFKKYPWAEKWNGFLPRLIDVPGREGVLIHAGNKAQDSLGCILVGENKVKGMVINSVTTLNDKLHPLFTSANKNDIWITIQ